MKTPADELNNAAARLHTHYEDPTDVGWTLAKPLADWLSYCAGDVGSDETFDDCDEPASVGHALRVARAVNGSGQ